MVGIGQGTAGGLVMRLRAGAALAVTSMMAMVALMVPTTAWAADSPEGAVDRLLDAIEAESVDDLDGLVCAEQQAAIRDRFDAAAGLPPGVDPDMIAGSIDLVISGRSVEVIEQTDERAEVRVGGQLRALVDEALVRRLAELSLEALGAEVEPEQIDELTDQLATELMTGSPVADDVTVTLEGSTWLVCDDILVGREAAASGDLGEGMCAYMSVEELNAIDEERGGAGFGSYTRASWDEETALCTYDEGESGIGSVRLGRFESTFEQVLEALGGGSDEMVDGRRARLNGNDLFVEIADGFLYVNAPAKSTPDGENRLLDHAGWRGRARPLSHRRLTLGSCAAALWFGPGGRAPGSLRARYMVRRDPCRDDLRCGSQRVGPALCHQR